MIILYAIAIWCALSIITAAIICRAIHKSKVREANFYGVFVA